MINEYCLRFRRVPYFLWYPWSVVIHVMAGYQSAARIERKLRTNKGRKEKSEDEPLQIDPQNLYDPKNRKLSIIL
jgi:hypothetical protein